MLCHGKANTCKGSLSLAQYEEAFANWKTAAPAKTIACLEHGWEFDARNPDLSIGRSGEDLVKDLK
jgi:hypothetical protein